MADEYFDHTMSEKDDTRSLSVRFDDTIEGLLLFILRFVSTYIHLNLRPNKYKSLLDEVDADPPHFTRPLTFLLIGSFLLALVMDAYPMGFRGLLDLIWVTDDIKEVVSERWKEALTISSLLTTGLPIILVVTALSVVGSRLLFRESKHQSSWFSISCYAFGAFAISVFILVSIDGVIAALGALLPYKLKSPAEDSIALTAILVLFVLIGFYILLVPFIVLSFSMVGMGLDSWPKKISGGLFASAYCLLGVYLMTQAASVVPTLQESYFPPPEADVMIFEEISLLQVEDGVLLGFEVMFENPLRSDLVVDLEGWDVEIQLRSGDDDILDQVSADSAWLDSLDGRLRAVADSEATTILYIEALVTGFTDFFCNSEPVYQELSRQVLDNEIDSPFPRYMLVYEASVRSNIPIQAADRRLEFDDVWPRTEVEKVCEE